MKRLDATLAFLAKSRARFLATVEQIPDSRWLSTPAEGCWSASEVVAHVATIEEAIVGGCLKTLQKAPYPVPALKKIHLPFFLALWRGRKVRSIIPTPAERIGNRATAYRAIVEVRERSLAFIAEHRERDLSAYRFPHPIFGSLNLYDWYRFIGYHELRHRKQLRELVEIFHR
jgi:DinB superfamily